MNHTNKEKCEAYVSSGVLRSRSHNHNEAGLVGLWPSARHLAQEQGFSLADRGEIDQATVERRVGARLFSARLGGLPPVRFKTSGCLSR